MVYISVENKIKYALHAKADEIICQSIVIAYSRDAFISRDVSAFLTGVLVCRNPYINCSDDVQSVRIYTRAENKRFHVVSFSLSCYSAQSGELMPYIYIHTEEIKDSAQLVRPRDGFMKSSTLYYICSSTAPLFFLSILAVLSFFPEPVAEECLSADKRRRGICMNTYDCRIQRGTFQGPCALGFGVCCVCEYYIYIMILSLILSRKF